jgi:adenine-specific DNA-methyltransferase
MITTDPKSAVMATLAGEHFVMFNGDSRDLLAALPRRAISLALTSPPYFLGKTFDSSRELEDFEALHQEMFPLLEAIIEGSGNICWQVGHHVRNGISTPLDFVIHSIFRASKDWRLRNRIVWTFGHGTHAKTRFSGRHETILWYSAGDKYYFNLDAARIPQKYRGKKYYKGPKKGAWSSNPAGKNPGDVWDIPNVKANHVEKTAHPCQFPVALAQRLVAALCRPGGVGSLCRGCELRSSGDTGRTKISRSRNRSKLLRNC